MAQANGHSTRTRPISAPLTARQRQKSTAQAAKLRSQMESAIERLLTALDGLDAATEDLEETDPPEGLVNGRDCDEEPALGSPENACTIWRADDCQRTRDGNTSGDQTNWARGGAEDGELSDCDDEEDDPGGGDINDEPQEDRSDDEPSLGWTMTGSGMGDTSDCEADSSDYEPEPEGHSEGRRLTEAEHMEVRRVRDELRKRAPSNRPCGRLYDPDEVREIIAPDGSLCRLVGFAR
jgi:hypothetical protein